MYLIVSATKNYKPKYTFNSDKTSIERANTIGHEICLTRPIVMILLSMNLITRDCTIVTRTKERSFLYSNIFKNIIAYDDIPNNIDNSQIIDITQVNIFYSIDKELTEQVENIPGWKDASFQKKEQILLQIAEEINGKCAPPMQIMEILDLEKRFPIMTKIRNKEINYRTELFNSLIADINYVDCSYLIKKDFVIVHHRVVTYSSDTKNTHEIVSAIKDIDPNIQIFIFSIKTLEDISPDVTIIDDLSIIASLMNNNKCKAIFSEYSGVGILSHYCHNKKIFYLETAYKVHEGLDIHDVIIKTNQPNNLYNKFDIQIFTNISIYIFKDLDSFLKDFKPYYFDKETKILRV